MINSRRGFLRKSDGICVCVGHVDGVNSKVSNTIDYFDPSVLTNFNEKIN
jgi:hypothetical protein